MNPNGGNNNNNSAANLEDVLQGLDEVLSYFDGFERVDPADVVDIARFGNYFPLIPIGTREHYLPSATQQAHWLNSIQLESLITQRDLPLTKAVPRLPTPPDIFMLPSRLLVNGLQEDGYEWEETKSHELFIDDVKAILATYSIRPGPNNQVMCRRTYLLLEQRDVVIVHYKYEPKEN